MAGYGSVIYQSLDTKHCDICLLLEEDNIIMVLVVYIYIQVTSQHFLSFLRLRIPTIAWCAVGNIWAPQFLSCLFDLGTVF